MAKLLPAQKITRLPIKITIDKEDLESEDETPPQQLVQVREKKKPR